MVKLYPSVPRKEGLEACEEALQARSKSLVSKTAMMEMIQTVLDNNVFGFWDKSYIQKEGIAIGSRQGKNFACAYMCNRTRRCCNLGHLHISIRGL